MKDVHTAASTGYTRQSSNYEQGRPDYPSALQGWLRDTLGIGAGTPVLDLGAGTGKGPAEDSAARCWAAPCQSRWRGTASDDVVRATSPRSATGPVRKPDAGAPGAAGGCADCHIRMNARPPEGVKR